MSLKVESLEIEGLDVTCSQLPAIKAYSVFARLGKVIGPALGALADVDVSKEMDDLEAMAPALSLLLSKLAEDTDLIMPLLSTCEVRKDGKQILLKDESSINRAFAGNFKAMLLTLKFSLTVNFSDFFAEGLAALGNQKAAEPESP